MYFVLCSAPKAHMQTPRTEFAQALRAISTERGLDPSTILDAVKQAIIAAYKRDAKDRGDEEAELQEYDVEINPGNGEAKIFSWPGEVVPEGQEESAPVEKKAPRPEDRKDVTPPGFGRIAAQIAKQVIHQKIREAEKGAIMGEFTGRVGSLISGMILRFDGADVRVDLGRTEGLMPVDERVSNERLNPNQRLSFLLKGITETPRGKIIILSRGDPEFVSKLFAREVPEISSKSVEIKGIAREAGVRTKIAVVSNQPGVDPVGSCVGQRGVRVQAVTNELNGERVDIVPYNEEITEYVKAALQPAEGLIVSLNKKLGLARVKAPEDQLSLAIGRDGQNARLAAKLTGWKVEIEPLPGVKVKEEEKDKQSLPLHGKEIEKEKEKRPAKKESSKKTVKEKPQQEVLVEKLEKEDHAQSQPAVQTEDKESDQNTPVDKT